MGRAIPPALRLGELAVYVWDARVAFGLIKTDTLATGGRGFEIMHLWPSWDVMGDWTTRCIKVVNWLNVPLAGN